MNTDLAKSLLEAVRALLGEKETYKDRFDLLHLHSRVASALSLDREFLPLIEADIELCQDEEERRSLIRQRDILARCARWHWFYADTKEHILTWQNADVSHNRLLSSVREYIEIVRRYFSCVSITWEPVTTRQCADCGTITVGDRACSQCGDVVKKEVESKRDKRNTAGSVDNFMRCIKSVMATKCDALPELVITSLDEFARSVGMFTSDEVRMMPLQENGHRGPYTISDLMEMLKSRGYTEYYPDKWWVAKHLWGWETQQLLPSTEEEIRRDCSAIFSLCASEDKGDRGSINREWLAVRILLNHRSKLSLPLSLDDFDIIKTPEILESYESTWSSACEKYSSWNASPLFGRWDAGR